MMQHGVNFSNEAQINISSDRMCQNVSSYNSLLLICYLLKMATVYGSNLEKKIQATSLKGALRYAGTC